MNLILGMMVFHSDLVALFLGEHSWVNYCSGLVCEDSVDRELILLSWVTYRNKHT